MKTDHKYLWHLNIEQQNDVVHNSDLLAFVLLLHRDYNASNKPTEMGGKKSLKLCREKTHYAEMFNNLKRSIQMRNNPQV